jgi:site-specific DNA-cytosine methylase
VTYTFLDCQGFAGGFACGATLAGFKLIGKQENPKNFGGLLMEANRALLGDDWQTQACAPAEWEPIRAHVVFGNPPCSGFSNFSAGTGAYGIDSKINDCMWDLHHYAARVRPHIVIMESVAQAFSKGLPLMQELSATLRRESGLAYRTTHVIQDNYSVGGCTLRRRYFLVNSLVPFGVERFEHTWLPTVGDAISDLRSLPASWDAQRYQAPPTWWSHQLRSPDGLVDGHSVIPVPNMQRLSALQRDHVRWEPGDRESEMLQKYYNEFGELPEEYDYQSHASHTRHLSRAKHLIDRGLETGGYGQTRYWPWDQPGRVITGHGPYQVRHPDNRPYTHRETARIMGFPDDWVCGSLRHIKGMHQYWGKGTSVHPALWITSWARESLDGNPGSLQGQVLPDGSHLIDVSPDWKAAARRLGIAEQFGLAVRDAQTRVLPPAAPESEEEERIEVSDEEISDLLDAELLMHPDDDPEEPAELDHQRSADFSDEAAELPEWERELLARQHVPPPDALVVPETLTTGADNKRYPGWEYDRSPAKGPTWRPEVLDRLVDLAQLSTGADAKPGQVAVVINSAAFRDTHGAQELRGCASYHVTQARARLAQERSPG